MAGVVGMTGAVGMVGVVGVTLGAGIDGVGSAVDGGEDGAALGGTDEPARSGLEPAAGFIDAPSAGSAAVLPHAQSTMPSTLIQGVWTLRLMYTSLGQ